MKSSTIRMAMPDREPLVDYGPRAHRSRGLSHQSGHQYGLEERGRQLVPLPDLLDTVTGFVEEGFEERPHGGKVAWL